ncbi:MAG: hypothetical protein COB12_07640 [Flavobacterium sp.]|nr:MAG: hypothetical protein COB12_07640 [Flavobacterium sp.]
MSKSKYYYSFFLFLFIIINSCKETPKQILDSGINDYALYDEKGELHRFSYYNNSKAIVLYVQGNGCPIVRNSLKEYNEIASIYSEKGFAFFMINSNIQDNRNNILIESKKYNFTIPVLIDSAQLIANELDINITSEIIILTPTTREIIYRGPINDRLNFESQKNIVTNNYLSNTLDLIIDDDLSKIKSEHAKGCKITRLSKINSKKIITYTKDIAPILIDHCVKCHVEGGIAPWAMTDYNEILGWSEMIKQVLLSKRMPPWKADPEIGEFQNSFAIEDSNVRKITTWIDNNLPYGIGEDILANVIPINENWEHGIPDKIITLKEEIIPASGLIPYRYQQIKVNITEDKWLKGVEIKPGNKNIVHHIVLSNKENSDKSNIVSRKLSPWTDNFIALAGGADQVTFFPKNTGVFIPKGTILNIQIHYTPSGAVESDQTEIGFYFYSKKPKKTLKSLSTSNYSFEIPPFGKNVIIKAEDLITENIKIHYIIPHMHYRGKSIKFKVQYPSGNIETLVSLPDYNFNWQWFYKLKKPISIPKGSKIIVEGVFDNTFQNPFNPDPSKKLIYGVQSTDEMLIGFFNYTLD